MSTPLNQPPLPNALPATPPAATLPPPSRSAPSRPAPITAAVRQASAVPAFSKITPRAVAPRIVVNGVEGWGKTSLGVQAPGAVIIMARGETGYATLVHANRVPSIPAVTVDSWGSVLGVLDAMIADPGEVRAVVIDALGGIERLCHEFVCARDFHSDWGEKGFSSFQRGYDVAITDWLGFLNRLDRLNEKGVAIWILSHVGVRGFKNPSGPDFDRYEAACHAKTWGVTHKWADAVLFATFHTVTQKDKGERAKGIGGTDRVVFTERRDAFDAKNRYGMPESIDIPGNPADAYALISSHITSTVKG